MLEYTITNMYFCSFLAGLDWGGVSRELFGLICVQLFDPHYGLFMRFKNDPQALVSSSSIETEHVV